MKNIKDKIPSVDGQKYKVKESYVNCGESTIYSSKTKQYIVEFKQNGRFVSAVDHLNQLCLGVWHNIGSCWQLYLSIDKGDNDQFILRATKMSSNNIVKELEGVNIESRSVPGNRTQKLGVGYMIYKRIKKNM
jgi:hypothetical protein